MTTHTTFHNREKLILILLLIGITPFLLNGFYNPILISIPAIYWIVEITSWVVIPLIIFNQLHEYNFDFSQAGFINRTFKIKFLYHLILVPLVLTLMFILVYDFSKILFPTNYLQMDFNYSMIIPSNRYLMIISVFYMALTAGVVEEFYYRSLLRVIIKNSYLYIIISSLVFAMVHFEGGIRLIFTALIYGIGASLYFLKTKNIWPLILGHFINDLILFRGL
jgi:membrane protease YdiL (CAAX protease family)